LGVTGEVYSVPTRVEVVYDHPPYKKGDVYYLLTYEGEGLYRTINSKGEVGEDGQREFDTEKETCQTPSNHCWLRMDLSKRQSVWWVQVKAPNNLMGWVISDNNFAHQDSCE